MTRMFNNDPAEVRPLHTASERVARAKAFAHAYEVAGRQKADAAIKVGMELLALREECKPGEFGATIQRLWPDVSKRTLQYWLAAARNKRKVRDAATLVEAEEAILDNEEPLDSNDQTGSCATVAQKSGQSDDGEEEGKSKQGKGKRSGGTKKGDEKKDEEKPVQREETAAERAKRQLDEAADLMTQAVFRIEGVIKSPIGPQLLEAAEAEGVEIKKDFVGETDRFGRQSDQRGERHYHPAPILLMLAFLNTFTARLARPAEVDF